MSCPVAEEIVMSPPLGMAPTTTPLATTASRTKSKSAVAVHVRVNPFTEPVVRVFSYGFQRVWPASKPACTQPDFTAYRVCAVRLLVRPTAVTWMYPGWVPAGTVTVVAGSVPSVRAATAATGAVPTARSTVSAAANRNRSPLRRRWPVRPCCSGSVGPQSRPRRAEVRA